MTIPSRRGALHFLALIATDDTERTKLADYNDIRPHSSADIRIQHLCNPHSPIVMHNLSGLHLSPNPTDPNSSFEHSISSHTPADESISSASASSSSSSSSSSSAKSTRTTRSTAKKSRSSTGSGSKPTNQELARKDRLRQKRLQMIEKAKKISSLDNSPANDRQLHVLRMVYDEITMYPNEPWMAILAIIIQRSFKQVKNWFSNERQKRGTGEDTHVTSSSGDRIRVRPMTLKNCKDWSDEWFEEVVMVHNFRVLCFSRMQAGRALSDTSSNYDGRS